MSLTDEQRTMETLYWWGVPTLFRAPHDPDPNNCDIALVGVPHSSGNGSTERDQHLGPRAVRNVSAHNRRYHQQFDFSPWETCRIHDLGDVPLPEAMDNEKCVERITAFFRKIADLGVAPVSIGGDHAITGPSFRRLPAATRSSPGAERRHSCIWTLTPMPMKACRIGWVQ